MTEIEQLPQNVALVRPAGSTQDLVQRMSDYLDLCVALLNESDEAKEWLEDATDKMY